MATVFISYRRGQDTPYARGIREKLAGELGKAEVYMDLDMRPGLQWRDAVTEALRKTKVFLPIIGVDWASTFASRAAQAAPGPTDWVRFELVTALDQKTPMIPLLVGGARPPATEDVPPDIAGVMDWQALELSDDRWDYDVDRLLVAIRETLGISAAPHEDLPKQHPAQAARQSSRAVSRPGRDLEAARKAYNRLSPRDQKRYRAAFDRALSHPDVADIHYLLHGTDGSNTEDYLKFRDTWGLVVVTTDRLLFEPADARRSRANVRHDEILYVNRSRFLKLLLIGLPDREFAVYDVAKDAEYQKAAERFLQSKIS